jgi:Domain of unknown function (DUF4783)
MFNFIGNRYSIFSRQNKTIKSTMTKNLLLTALFASFLSINISTIDEVVKAIKSGNSDAVSQYFDNTVEITLPDKSNSYSKRQAALVLRDFFALNEIKDFQILHQSDNAGAIYCIGNLITNNGVFRTTIFLKDNGTRELIQELRFEK